MKRFGADDHQVRSQRKAAASGTGQMAHRVKIPEWRERFIREFSGRWQVRRNHRNRQKGSSNWSISWLNVSRWWGVRPYSRIASRCSRVG